jgi:hypothetical protein
MGASEPATLVRRERSTVGSACRVLVTCAVEILCLLLVACGPATVSVPKLPGGVYTSTTFHFTITYPAGWQPNALSNSAANAPIPLTVVITRSGSNQTDTSLLSTFTVTVLNAHDPAIASTIRSQQAQASGADPTLLTVTLAGQTAYATKPLQQQLPASQRTTTHTNYYILRGAYEYQLSTDAVSGDNADGDLHSMLQSFAFTS